MNNVHIDIKSLLEKYYRGNSSVEEELILSNYFLTEEDIPAEYEADRILFASMAKDKGSFTAPADLESDIISRIGKVRGKKRWRIISAVAAAAALTGVAVILPLTLIKDNQIPAESLAEVSGQDITVNDSAINVKNTSDDSMSNSLTENSFANSSGTESGIDQSPEVTKTYNNANIKSVEKTETLTAEEQEALNKGLKALANIGRQLKQADNRLAAAETNITETYAKINGIVNNLK